MFVPAAESRFRKGMQYLARGQAGEALPFISEALDVQLETDERGFVQATYLSYHGLCLCLTRNGMREGLQHCRRASELDPSSAVIWWNLGRVSLKMGRRREAHDAFRNGLQLEPKHRGIRRDLRSMGVRGRPVLAFLSRDHVINRVLGRARALLRSRERAGPVSATTPLGRLKKSGPAADSSLKS